jgi:hypothetical protein
MRYVTDPKLAKEVVMRDGTKYAAPRGRFTITRADHLAEMDSGNKDVYSKPSFTAAKGRECPQGHAGWSWQSVCGRCGETLT